MIFVFLSKKKSYFSPEFSFSVCFIPGILYAFFYVEKWNLNMTAKTCMIIFTGIFVFYLVSELTSLLFDRQNKTKKNLENLNIQTENISKNKLIFLFCLNSLILVLTYVFLINNYGNSISEAMFSYRLNTNSGDLYSEKLPSILKLMRRFSISASYIFTYLFSYSIIAKKKNNRNILLMNIIICLLIALSLGGRGEALQIIFGGIVQYYFLYKFNNNMKKLSPRSITMMVSIFILLILTFSYIGKLLGRQMDFLDFNDYIAVYLSAELKNLDSLVRESSIVYSFDFKQTFSNFVNSILSKVSSLPNVEYAVPYRYINGTALGNVGTVFYPFYYDARFIGVVIYTSIMAFICQLSYIKANNETFQSKISIRILIYSYIWYTIIFSFFSNKFFEMIFNPVFIWTLVAWFITKVFLEYKIIR